VRAVRRSSDEEPACGLFLLCAPEVLEPGRRKLGVANRMLDVLVTEISLKRAGVAARLIPAERARRELSTGGPY
jgi:hypothetical protein